MVRTRRRLAAKKRLIWLVVVFALLIAACGGGGEEEPTDETADDGGTTTLAPILGDDDSGDQQAFEQTFTIGHEAWHSGFHLTFGDGTYIGEPEEFTDEVDYFVFIDVNFENLSDSDISFLPDQFALVSDGNATAATLGSELPTVPGGLSSDGTLTFRTDENFDPAGSVLLIGNAGQARAQVPLGDGELISLEPRSADISGSIELELIDVTFTGADLTYDNRDFFSVVDEGLIALTLNFDVLSRLGGNWSLFGPDFALIGPDGNAVTPDSSMISNIPGAEEGVVTPGNSLTFLASDPPTGDYTLRLTVGSWFVGDDGVDQGTLEFSLP